MDIAGRIDRIVVFVRRGEFFTVHRVAFRAEAVDRGASLKLSIDAARLAWKLPHEPPRDGGLPKAA